MRITKKKEAAGSYRAHVDGKPTKLLIMKDDGRRQWGAPQEWDVYTERFAADGTPDHHWLFTAKGLDSAVAVLETLAEEFS